MGSDLQADYVGELRERAEKAEGALKVAAAHNLELQEENDRLKARIAELEEGLRPLRSVIAQWPYMADRAVLIAVDGDDNNITMGDLRNAARLAERKAAAKDSA